MIIPPDILQRIQADFQSEPDRTDAEGIIKNLWARPLNVGPDQLARSILILSDKHIEKLRTIAETLNGDPRDVIMQAERKMGDPGHYFVSNF